MKTLSKPSLAVLAAALMLAGAGCTGEEAKPVPPAEKPPAAAPAPTPKPSDIPPAAGTPEATAPSTTPSASTVEFSAADRGRAEKFINENQGKSKEAGTYEMIAGGAVQDATTPTLYYFATASVAADGNSAFAGLYSYDTKTRQWSRLYKETTKADADGTLRVLKVVSLADGKVYLVRETDLTKVSTSVSGHEAFVYDIALAKPALTVTKLP